jgi:hypothetical protein
MKQGVARRMWQALEPYHALVYFAPERKAAYEGIGLKGGWMGYFASRSAAMGPVPAEVVVACFYNFHPRLVHRAIPDAWTLAPPERIVATRYQVADAALRRLLGGAVRAPELAAAAKLARRALEGCDPLGRPLYGAHAALPWPDEPHLELWHACTLLREFRGDGHVASLLVEGIDGCEANVLQAGAGRASGEVLRSWRGWSQEEWGAAVERLRRRGWVDAAGALTDAGKVGRDGIEYRTDELALAPWRRLGEGACTRLWKLVNGPVATIVAGDGVPQPILASLGVDGPLSPPHD